LEAALKRYWEGELHSPVNQYIGESEVFILIPLLILILFSAFRSVSVFRSFFLIFSFC
jgi:hypothetical protein